MDKQDILGSLFSKALPSNSFSDIPLGGCFLESLYYVPGDLLKLTLLADKKNYVWRFELIFCDLLRCEIRMSSDAFYGVLANRVIHSHSHSGDSPFIDRHQRSIPVDSHKNQPQHFQIITPASTINVLASFYHLSPIHEARSGWRSSYAT